MNLPRAQLFEFEDLPWFPHVIRQGMMDYLRHMITWTEFYKPAAEIIVDVLKRSGENRIIEVCAGSGGGVLKMREYLNNLNCKVPVFLSDLYPNIGAYEMLKKNSGGSIGFISGSVNVLDGSSELKGVRVMFSALHHFRPEQVKAICEDAAKKNIPIAFFDAGSRSIINILLVWLVEPLTFILLTPFFTPFRWSRLLFTYLIPLIPLCTLWDGTISVLRFHSEKELKKISESVNSSSYMFKAGHFRNKIGVKVNYIKGTPLT